MDQPTPPPVPSERADAGVRPPALPPEVHELRSLIDEVRQLLDALAASPAPRS